MNDIFRQLGDYGIVPVVVLNSEKDAIPLAQSLSDAGLSCAEVTFRTGAAEAAIRAITSKFPSMLVGAGTVFTINQIARAVSAGARFIVSPGLDPELVHYCKDKNIPVCPGTCTPTEMEQALSMGLDVVKFFPAEASGGLNFIKAVASPFTTLKFMPTGGINAQNVREYLAFDRVLCCGGSWMVKGSLIDEGKFDRIRDLAREAVEIVREIRS